MESFLEKVEISSRAKEANERAREEKRAINERRANDATKQSQLLNGIYRGEVAACATRL